MKEVIVVHEFSDPYEPPSILSICSSVYEAKKLFPKLYSSRQDEHGDYIYTELHTEEEIICSRYSLMNPEPFIERYELNTLIKEL